MLIFLILLGALTLFAPPIRLHRTLNQNYLDKEQLLPIKGFFVVLVFFSHFKSYATLSDSILDTSFNLIINLIGQAMVAMFFFYSGYGIYTSYLKKENYIKHFLQKRFLPVWLSFSFCVMLFHFENLLLGEHYSLSETLLAFTGWTSIGNSNWFMFVTFAMYILVFISLSWQKNKQGLCGLITFTLLSLVLLIILVFTKESWWYNTLLCFALGMWYAYFREKIDTFFANKSSRWSVVFVVLVVALIVFFLMQRKLELLYCIYSLIFSLVVIAITMKIEVRCSFLKFLGKHVFSIYILQRLVFRVLMVTPIGKREYLLIIISAVITFGLSLIYDRIISKIFTLSFTHQ